MEFAFCLHPPAIEGIRLVSCSFLRFLIYRIRTFPDIKMFLSLSNPLLKNYFLFALSYLSLMIRKRFTRRMHGDTSFAFGYEVISFLHPVSVKGKCPGVGFLTRSFTGTTERTIKNVTNIWSFQTKCLHLSPLNNKFTIYRKNDVSS